MNGGADLGGMQGFGPVIEEIDEPNFHADWEARILAIVIALGACGQWNIDQSRHARETLPPAQYIAFPYYRIWLEGVLKLLLTREMVDHSELADGKLRTPAKDVRGTLQPEKVWDSLHSLAGAADREAFHEAAFKIGDSVKTINTHPTGHTRLPRYARAKQGKITQIFGTHVFPDSAGNNRGDDPQWLYQVRFEARELWGSQADPRDSVTLDLWEPHLERI